MTNQGLTRSRPLAEGVKENKVADNTVWRGGIQNSLKLSQREGGDDILVNME